MIAALALTALGLPLASAPDESLGLRVPAGFTVSEYADSRLANDIYCMTTDPRGRMVVSGRGYIRILSDADGDGRADRATDFAAGPADGAMGMLWEGSTLYVTGDGGLRAYRDENRDDRADGPARLLRAMKTGGEHDAHAIRRGPDGWLYVLCGNMTGIDRRFAELPTSPVREPIAGCVVRLHPQSLASEIVADGFRNAYDMDFNGDGELFAYDSDNERCVSLPWYEATRFYHVIPGGHYGWLGPQRAVWWRLPPYLPDVVAPVATLGRGSPTGVECYRHTQFPAAYRGAMLAADWTFGRVYVLQLRRAGASYTATPERFLESVGDSGFAPTDLVVQPDTGDLFVSIGGRGTRGAVYRVRYTGSPDRRATAVPRAGAIALDAVEPRALRRAATDDDPLQRLRALQQALRHRTTLPAPLVEECIVANWGHSDRYVRWAAARLVSALEPSHCQSLRARAHSPVERLTYWLGAHPSDPAKAAQAATDVLRTNPGEDLCLQAVRLMQLTCGELVGPAYKDDVRAGYTPARDLAQTSELRHATSDIRRAAVSTLRQALTSSRGPLDREVTRTLAIFRDDSPETLSRVADRLTADSDPIDDVHYLIVLSRLAGTRSDSLTRRVAAALLALDRKCAARQLNRDRNWPFRLAELHEALAEPDPQLNRAMLDSAEFGRSDHVLWAQSAGFDRRRAAERLLARAEQDRDFEWTDGLVELLGELPPEVVRPALRRQWDSFALRDAIVHALARPAEPEDRGRFVDALDSPRWLSVLAAVEALQRLPATSSEESAELLALVRALRRFQTEPDAKEARTQIGRRLVQRTGEQLGDADAKAWTDWLTRHRPALAARLSRTSGVDAAAWRQRLARIPWTVGDAERGRQVYVRASCSACHSGARALGPDLRGAASRFSRDDLFTAILEPSRDVPPRYQATLVATQDGKQYQGAVIYDAVDSLILQTGAESVVRIANTQIAERRLSPTSLMPTGLLDMLSDAELADLYAYLRSMR